MTRRKQHNPFDRWETMLIRLAAACVATLFLVQVIIYHDVPRRYLSRVDRLEGEAVTWQTPLVAGTPLVISEGSPVARRRHLLRDNREIVVRMVSPAASADAYAVVNGERAGDFGGGAVAVAVYEGDYVEIDASRLPVAARFVVTVPDGGLVSPANGALIEGRGEVIPVGKVKLKQ